MLNLEIITPRKTVVKDEVEMVEATGSNGEFGILPGHTEFLTTLDIGEIRYMKGGQMNYLASGSGFAEVVDDKVVILINTAEFAKDIDVERAKASMERVQEILRSLSYDQAEYRMYELALLKSIARISVASKKL